MKSFIKILTLSVFALLVMSCSAAPTTTQAPAVEPTQAPVSAYPSPDSTGYPSYPAPQQQQQVVDPSYPAPTAFDNNIVVPTTAPGTGKVTGKMLLKGAPLYNVSIGLGAVLKNKDGKELVTSFERAQSPRTSTLSDGSFIFYNVPPGRYGLIYADNPETYLLLIPGKQDAVLVTVEADKTADLGVLDFDDLP